MGFYNFIFDYYEKELQYLYGFDIYKIEKDKLTKILGEASSLKKFIYDIQEEGYEVTFQEFKKRLNAQERLDNFINKGLNLLGGKSEEELFYLYPKKIKTEFSTKECPVKVYELQEYLDYLSSLKKDAVDYSFIYGNEKWIEKTEAVLKEMAEFTSWILQNGCSNYVFLLRDTLLPYLGLSELNKNGAVFNIVPVMIGRHFLSKFGDADKLYNMISDTTYDVLLKYGDISLKELIEHFREVVYSCTDESFKHMLSFTEKYLANTLQNNHYNIIESGVQGTFPLLISSVSQKIQQFLMYAAVPWLKDTYRDIIFRDNYNFLRDLETFISQDNLFAFHSIEGDKFYIKEYQDERLKSMAYYEITRFKELLNVKLKING